MYFTTVLKKKKTLTGKKNPWGIRTRELLKLVYYSLLKSQEKSAMLKELRLQTSKFSFNTE